MQKQHERGSYEYRRQREIEAARTSMTAFGLLVISLVVIVAAVMIFS